MNFIYKYKYKKHTFSHKMPTVITCRCCSAVVSELYIPYGDECSICYHRYCPECAPPNNCGECGVEIPLFYTECPEHF